MSERTPRRRPLAVIAVAGAALALAVAATGWLATGSASAGTLSGSLYRDPGLAVSGWVAANPGDSRMPTIRDKIASQPQGHWLSTVNLATVGAEVSTLVNAANAANQVPLLVAYGIPNRDCGGASSGGASDLNQYQQWISQIAPALGNRTVIIIMEPDSLALQTCLNSSEIAARGQAIATAVQTMKAANANARIYLDGGHSAWNPANEQANRLAGAGVQYADGFYTNASNFQPTSSEASYGRSILAALQGRGISGKHQIIDTSRNGGAAGDWCADDNTDRRIGTYPTLDTGDANIDGYLWIKPPGEADGCAYQAGSFQPALAYSLASSAPYPPTPSPSATTPSPSVTPTQVPTSAPPTSPPPTSAPPTTNPPSGACTAAYQTVNSWPGGFQAQVTVTAGAAAIHTWTVTWTLPSGQTITQLWSGVHSVSGGTVTVTNAPWNGALAAGASTQFGFLGTGTAATPVLTCAGS